MTYSPVTYNFSMAYRHKPTFTLPHFVDILRYPDILMET